MTSSESHQLRFAFADNPRGSEDGPKADVSAGRKYLLHQADLKEMNETEALADDSGPANGPVDLLERVASLPNLARALLSVARNKGAAGVDGQSVEAVVEASPDLLPKIGHALRVGTYQPGDIRRVWIAKPGGGERGLGIPNVVDRMVQQAVYQLLEPIFEPMFHDSSHGFRRKRGPHTAIAEATRHFNEGYGVTVDIDLSKFFDRVNHQRLLNRLARHIDDGRVLKLIHRMLKAKVVLPNGTRIPTKEGAPQGGPLSPLLSNIVLDELDNELTRRGLRFVRYADDITVFVRSPRAGDRVMASVQRFITRTLRLVVNEAKSSVSEPFDLTFLGFRLGKVGSEEVTIHVSKRSAQRLKARIRALTPRSWGGSFGWCMRRINRYLNGWIGYFRLCTGTSSFASIDAHIRRRLRAILVRQKKRPRHLFRHLLRHGVPRGMAWKSAYGIRGHWKRSSSFGVHRVYSNAWFAERLVDLYRRWQEFHSRRAMEQRMLFCDN